MGLRKILLAGVVLLQVFLLAGCGKPLAPVITIMPQNDSATISWTAVPDATGYKLYKASTAGGPYTFTGQSTETGTELTVSGLPRAGTVYFVVTAVKTSSESAYSNEVMVEVPYFWDDFESYETSLSTPWSMFLGSSGAVEADPVSGDKAFHAATTSNYIVSGDASENVVVTASVKDAGSSNFTSLILYGRYLDTQNYYCLMLSKSDQKLWISRVKNNSGGGIASAALPAGFDFSKYHTLRLEIDGSTLRGYLDGELLATATNTDIGGAGLTGMGIQVGEGYIDDFKVYYR